MTEPLDHVFRGKKILVVGGRPHDNIDGFHYFANHRRDPAHGTRAAAAIAALGATVVLITTQPPAIELPHDVTVVTTVDDNQIVSTAGLLEACARWNSQRFDAVVQLANITMVSAVRQSEHRLKVKTNENDVVSIDVEGNIDVVMRLRWMFPFSNVHGVTNDQQWFRIGDVALGDGIHAVAERTLGQYAVTDGPYKGKGGGDVKSPAGRKIVVTSGATAEPISNLGDVITSLPLSCPRHAVAEALEGIGADVVLITGPSTLASHVAPSIHTINVDTSEQMFRAIVAELAADVLVHVAAVGNFYTQNPLEDPLNEGVGRTLDLHQGRDLFEAVGKHASLRPSVVVGVERSTSHELENARDRLDQTGADAMFVDQTGFAVSEQGASSHSVCLVTPSGQEILLATSEMEVGKIIGQKIGELMRAAESKSQPALVC